MTTPRLFLSQLLLWLFTLTSPAVAAINLTMADLQNGIGDGVTKGLYTEGDLAHATLHGLVGCAAGEALDGNCASGAAAGIAQSIYAGTQDENAPQRSAFGSDREFLAAHRDWKAGVAQNARLIGASVGYISSGGHAANVNNGASIARSGALNNYLKHTELDRARALFDARENLQREITRLSSMCLFCNAQEILALRAELDAIAIEINTLQITSASNTLKMMEVCAAGNTADCRALRVEAEAYLGATDGWFGMESRLNTVFTVSADVMDGVDVDWGGNLDEWLTEQYDLAELDEAADWGAISGTVADHAIMRDGWINVGVGTAAVGVATIGCIGTSGWGCVAIVGGAAAAESNTIYDGAATVITGESQNGYIKNTLLSAGFDDVDADQYERWIENGLAVATIGIDGVLVIRSTSGAVLNTGRYALDDFARATNRGRLGRTEFDKRFVGQFRDQAQADEAYKQYRLAAETDSEIVLGRLPDTEAGSQLGMTRLDSNDWSPSVNDAFVQGGIDANKPFYLGSNAEISNYRAAWNLLEGNRGEHAQTVFFREMKQLRDAGYRLEGDYMLPPN